MNNYYYASRESGRAHSNRSAESAARFAVSLTDIVDDNNHTTCYN
jgi:hypothetical protein